MSQPQQPLVQSTQQPSQVLGQNRTFSPHPQQQHTNSPTISQSQIRQQPQSQAQRPSPDPRSPTFPAGNFSSSGHSTPGIRTPTSGLASPAVNHFSQPQTQTQPQQVHQNAATTYTTPYTPTQITQQQPQQQNGRATPGNTVNQQRYAAPQQQQQQHQPQTHPTTNNMAAQSHMTPGHPSPSAHMPQTNGAAHPYSAAAFSPNLPQPVTTPGTMGPPSNSNLAKPVVQPKAYQYEMDDSLAGTGINLDEEEQYMNDYETRVGFGALAPGGRGSFYGAGPMNQSSESSQSKSQEEMVTEAADRAWSEAAQRYAASVTADVKNGFVLPALLHARMSKVAAANGLDLVLDSKNPQIQPLGRFNYINNYKEPFVKVSTKTTPDKTVVTTVGSFLPKEAILCDQIALLSLATRTRIGELLADANLVASNRQQTAHGVIPPDWADAAKPYDALDSTAGSSTISKKRPAEELSNGLPTPVSEVPPKNHFASTIVSLGKTSRDAEEARLRKRQKRAEQAAEREKNPDGVSASRSASVAPGTPGSVAPDPDVKPLSKKESKKAARLADTSSVSVNSTLSQFMGGKKKKYSWMTGGGGSGTNTPKGSSSGLPAAAGGPAKAAKGPLTQDASQQIGGLREDSVKGKHIQMRDWIESLENNAYLTDQVALQQAYIRLERSDWGDKVKIPAPAPSPIPLSSAVPAATGATTPVVATPVATTPTVASPVISTPTVTTPGASTPIVSTPIKMEM